MCIINSSSATAQWASVLNNGISRKPTKLGSQRISVAGRLHNEFFGAWNWKRWDMLHKCERFSLLFRLFVIEPLGSSCHQHCEKIVTTSQYPQNADLPPVLPKNKKKPFPIPVKELRRAARARQKKNKGRVKKPLGPPRNGLLVPELIPIGHAVFEARTRLINGLAKLLKVVPAHACRYCSEVHIGPVGHTFKTCKGPNFGARRSLHEWTKCNIDDILVPVDSFHLYDRLGRRLTHEERFQVERLPAVVELCIQAGVDLPQYPTKRRVEPVCMIGKSILDPNEDDEQKPTEEMESSGNLNFYEECQQNDMSPLSPEEIQNLAEQTIQAWDTMRWGARKLMRKYSVKVCGYCPEVHVGPSGHKAQLCGAYKHQQRNGQHGWQAATLDDLIPPKYVWHVPDPCGPPLRQELSRFYGQTPGIVELCVQAGAAIPEAYKPMMRLDVVVPDCREAKMVA